MIEKISVIHRCKPSKKKFIIKPLPQPKTLPLTATELRKRHSAEYNSWRNGKSRAGSNWQPEFKEFRDFLRIMGNMPERGCTLDRINNEDPRYGEGFCRWATKRQQAANRSTSAIVIDRNGEHVPASECPQRPGDPPASLGKALTSSSSPFGADPRTYRPWPKTGHLAQEWERRYLLDGIQFETRFEYLTRELEHFLEKAGSYLENNYDPMDDQPCEETIFYLQESKRAYDLLQKIKRQKPEWEKAVRIHEAIKFERQLMRRPGFLDRNLSVDDNED